MMEYANKENLYEYIQQTRNGLNETNAFKFFFQVVSVIYLLFIKILNLKIY